MTHTEQAEVWCVRESVFIKYETLGVSSSEIIYLEINTLKEILRIRAAVLGVLASESNHLHSVFTGNF